MTTTEAIITEIPSNDKEAPAMGGGMGGMDY
jgi:chaperonin GroEL